MRRSRMLRWLAAVAGSLATVAVTGRGHVLAQSTLTVHALTTEYRVNPLGTDTPRPRLSWKLESSLRSTVQAAYQVQVASDAAALQREKNLVLEVGSGSYKFFVPGKR